MTAIWLWTTLAGCHSFAEEDFPDTWSQVYCTRLLECERGIYRSSYSGREDCVRTQALYWYETARVQTDDFGCVYDEDAARDALDELRDLTRLGIATGEATTAWQDVWSDCF